MTICAHCREPVEEVFTVCITVRSEQQTERERPILTISLVVCTRCLDEIQVGVLRKREGDDE